MRDLVQEVLDLQLEHSSENTPAMARRGVLIRDEIPSEIRSWKAAQASALLPFRGRLNVQGRDGTGLKTFVPWVRIHSPELSPSAQNGWYVVYLFKADGSGVFLCLSHGSTRFDGGDFIPRSAAEAAALMTWARSEFSADAEALGFEIGVDLGSDGRLSRAYETTTAFSIYYPRSDLPSDEEFASDALKCVGLLGQVYRQVELGRGPENESPDVREAIAALEELARPKLEVPALSRPGQGLKLSAADRQLIENHAMLAAKNWLIANGFENITDTHLARPFDYMATKDGVEHIVEVKGTTASLGSILLTANEVRVHRDRHPNNLLLVVHDIDLLEMRAKASGGLVHAVLSWDIDGANLEPLSYRCIL